MTSKSIIITIVVALIVGIGAFYGGALYEKNSLSKQGLLRSGNGQFGNGQRRPSGQGSLGAGGSGFARGNGGSENGEFVAGDIILKDDPAPEQAQSGAGKSITIKTRDGGSKIIFFSDSTLIGKSVQSTSSDLNTGEQVMVSGKSNSDGTFTAQNIQIRPNQP